MKQFSVNITVDPSNSDALSKIASIGTNTKVGVSTIVESETMAEALKKAEEIGEVTTIQQRPTMQQQVQQVGTVIGPLATPPKKA